METKKRTRHAVAESIPHEIVFDILTRLPVKSLSRFRCVSQLWNTTISDRLFVKTHHNRSLTRPDVTSTLLITFADKTNLARTIYIVDHRENEDEDPVAAVRHLIISGVVASYVSQSVNGLICLKVNKHIQICNPSTREFITLPYLEIETPTSPLNSCVNRTSFGYDPINNQHKVLNTWFMNIEGRKMATEHRVFVLGADSWRRIGDGPPHFSRTRGVSVNGAIYYAAWTTVVNEFLCRNQVLLVEFDVRLETFRFIQFPDNLWQLKTYQSAFIPFDGHFAIVDYQQLRHGNNIKIWVLEDSLKPTWVHKSIVFPPAWSDVLGDREFWLLSGTIRTSEIILAPRSLEKPFYLFYLDLKNVSVRKVEIGSLPDYDLELGVVFNNMLASDHVENILSLRNLNF